MRRQKELDFLLTIFLVLNAIRNICFFFSMLEIARLVFYVAHIVLAFIIVIIVMLKISKPIKVTGHLIAAIILISMLVIVPMSYGLSIWAINSFTPISFLFTMLFIVVSKDIRISDHTIKVCCITYIVQAIVAIFCSFMPSSFEYGALVLHIGNPNQTAIILWAAFVFSYLYWEKKLVKKNTFLLWVIMICLAIMIILTQSRSISLSLIIVLVWHFLGNRKARFKNFPLLIQYALIFAPLYIPVIILLLMNILPSGITIFGKLLFSGREQIWQKIADAFLQNPFSYHLDVSPFYSNVMFNNVVSLKGWGAHNGFFAIQWSYGILVSMSVVYILYCNLIELKKNAENNVNSCIVYIVTLATIFSLSFEEALLMGNIFTTAILPLLFLIGRSEHYNSLSNVVELKGKR
mgnify:CR=1 FL=1